MRVFCSNCGSKASEKINFCSKCGNRLSYINQQENIQQTASPANQEMQLIGYSEKINDLAFEKFKKSSNRGAYIFAIVLAIIAIIGIPIYGSVSGEIDFPYSFYYGLGIGGMLVIIAFVQSTKQKSDTSWDGVVIDKKQAKRREQQYEDGHIGYYTEYIVKIRRDDGKIYKDRSTNTSYVYDYYQVGDRVRHHKGFPGYEKYDKSKDTNNICIACLRLHNIQENTCKTCKCPLLK